MNAFAKSRHPGEGRGPGVHIMENTLDYNFRLNDENKHFWICSSSSKMAMVQKKKMDASDMDKLHNRIFGGHMAAGRVK